MQRYESPSVKEHLIKTFIQKAHNIAKDYQYHLRYYQYDDAIKAGKHFIHFVNATVYEDHGIHPLRIVDSDPYLYLVYFSAKALIVLSEKK